MRSGIAFRCFASVRRLPNHFVPQHEPVLATDLELLQDFITKHSRLFVITGAGISTESGIPDYRSEGVGLYARTNHRPMTIQQFLNSEDARRRYWARNFIGWTNFSASQPNAGHRIVRSWELSGRIGTLVTQNVDGLHKKAGSTDCIELHGTGRNVVCLGCHHELDRAEFQTTLQELNPHFSPVKRISEVRPDGDIYLEESEVAAFKLPECPSCHTGILKPDIVFFGANVKREKVEHIYGELRKCDSVLVLGSSLQVFSSLRFVLTASDLKIPIGIVTLGSTRADHLAPLNIKARLGEILPLVKI